MKLLMSKFIRVNEGVYLTRYYQDQSDSGEPHRAIEFKVWLVESVLDGTPQYSTTRSNPQDPDLIKPVIAGSVKWDGCINYDFPETEDCKLHACTRDELLAIGQVLARVFDQAAPLCYRADPEGLLEEAKCVVTDADFGWPTGAGGEEI